MCLGITNGRLSHLEKYWAKLHRSTEKYFQTIYHLMIVHSKFFSLLELK